MLELRNRFPTFRYQTQKLSDYTYNTHVTSLPRTLFRTESSPRGDPPEWQPGISLFVELLTGIWPPAIRILAVRILYGSRFKSSRGDRRRRLSLQCDSLQKLALFVRRCAFCLIALRHCVIHKLCQRWAGQRNQPKTVQAICSLCG